jgi:acetyltransferase
MHVVRWSEAREALMGTPPSLPEHFTPDVAAARTVIDGALSDQRSWLDPIEIRALFAAYAIPVVPSLLANDADDAAKSASQFLDSGQTVVVKILSRDIQRKSDIGGVRLNLTTGQAVRTAAIEILARAGAARPSARIAGVIVQPMIVRPQARELIADRR